ncbi:MAG: SH3 domain-containing protein [Candidatus Binatia bacterium]
MRHALVSFTLFWFVFLPANSSAELIDRKGRIEGESHVNLRSGPGLDFLPIRVLREGEEVTVEGEETGWYQVFVADGEWGYVHKTLVRLLSSAEKMEGPRIMVTVPGEGKQESQLSSPPEGQAPEGKRTAIFRLLEGKEWETVWWLGLAICIFFLGWICGGNYYLRRDRINRTKLRF